MEFEKALLHPGSFPELAIVAVFDNCGRMPVTLHDEWKICYNCHKATKVTKLYLRARGLKVSSTMNNVNSVLSQIFYNNEKICSHMKS